PKHNFHSFSLSQQISRLPSALISIFSGEINRRESSSPFSSSSLRLSLPSPLLLSLLSLLAAAAAKLLLFLSSLQAADDEGEGSSNSEQPGENQQLAAAPNLANSSSKQLRPATAPASGNSLQSGETTSSQQRLHRWQHSDQRTAAPAGDLRRIHKVFR
ncbi:hypothetical protein AABB24_009581, partial [Solanum stoloniferum]